jgi:anthranilate/para-aminobenzoate synthase component II
MIERYHSWVINNRHLPNELELTAQDLDEILWY